MYRRKIQLIAGSTYSISLPKEWVKKNNLREQNEILLVEKSDRTLVISPTEIQEKEIKEITLDVDDYHADIDQIMFSVYYIGFETIHLVSKKEISKEVRSRVRKVMRDLSGSEISFEDQKKITIKVLLDISKIDIIQILYRINLILDLSIKSVLEELDINEIRRNEDEIDRLYNLVAKIISVSLIKSQVLISSKINNISLVPAYFLISKRLENIGDNVHKLSEHLHKNKPDFSGKKEILRFILSELDRTIKHLIGNQSKMFEKKDDVSVMKVKKLIDKLGDKIVRGHLKETLRFTLNIEEEVVNISFYNKMLKENIL